MPDETEIRIDALIIILTNVINSNQSWIWAGGIEFGVSLRWNKFKILGLSVQEKARNGNVTSMSWLNANVNKREKRWRRRNNDKKMAQ